MNNINDTNNTDDMKSQNNSITKKHQYLKKGEGKLASQFHGETKFAIQRKKKIIKEHETIVVLNTK